MKRKVVNSEVANRKYNQNRASQIKVIRHLQKEISVLASKLPSEIVEREY